MHVLDAFPDATDVLVHVDVDEAKDNYIEQPDSSLSISDNTCNSATDSQNEGKFSAISPVQLERRIREAAVGVRGVESIHSVTCHYLRRQVNMSV